MTNLTPHKLTIKNKSPGKLSTGMNTVIELDGKPLRGVSAVSFSVEADGIARVRVEMYADVAIMGDIQGLFQKKIKVVVDNSPPLPVINKE